MCMTASRTCALPEVRPKLSPTEDATEIIIISQCIVDEHISLCSVLSLYVERLSIISPLAILMLSLKPSI